ncbi:MAG: ATP-binding cassette domain-containing protein [Paracoccus sp. (in: a-proteobacteria)]|uniref:ABC transporter ATP-binding protein n=1 Tax=Paracoccus sp. TaxID=267 RepID=UPI0039E6B419
MLELVLDGLRLRYPDLAEPALDLPRLRVAAGSSLAVTGPSGAGKSTFINAITGLERPTEGCVLWQGQDIARLSESGRDRWRARHVGLVMQDFHLFPGLSAVENVLLPARFRHLRLPSQLRERAVALLERVGLTPGARGIETFSRGEMQRVAIARALLSGPGVIVADEPTASLDPGSGAAVCALLVALAQEHRATLIVVTHDQALSGRLQRRITLGGGRLVADTQGESA